VRVRNVVMIAVLVASGCGYRGMLAQAPGAQDVPQGRGQFAGMQRVSGEVTAVSGDTLSVTSAEGDAMKVTVTTNTRILRGQGVTAKVSDLKPGDGVMAVGLLDAPNKTLHAAMMFVTDAATMAKLRENLGKTYIAGRITAIDADNLKITIERPDHVSQTIAVDESTSFRRGRVGRAGEGGGYGGGAARAGSAPASANAEDSITLADLKVGDRVAGQGVLKNGVFVPTQLSVATPHERGQREGMGVAPQPQ
jgi:hypothetical protein